MNFLQVSNIWHTGFKVCTQNDPISDAQSLAGAKPDDTRCNVKHATVLMIDSHTEHPSMMA